MKKLIALAMAAFLYAAIANIVGAAASSANEQATRLRAAQIEAATK